MFCKRFEPLEVVGENGDMRGQGIRSVRAKKRGDHTHSRPIRCYGVPPFFRPHRSSYDAVALHRGPCETLRRDRKLATSSGEKPLWRHPTKLLRASPSSRVALHVRSRLDQHATPVTSSPLPPRSRGTPRGLPRRKDCRRRRLGRSREVRQTPCAEAPFPDG